MLIDAPAGHPLLPVLPPPGLNPQLRLRPLRPGPDSAIVHPWFTMDYAHYWNMQHLSRDQTRQFYADMAESGHARAYLGLHQGRPAFVAEVYDPAMDAVGRHYAVQPGDLGMHFFVGPARQPIRHFTRDVLRAVMALLFYELGAARVVVEPDIRNDKVHRLNRAVGFVYDRPIQLPQKVAHLAFCTRTGFERSVLGE